jgi:predicted HTH domain antitoxin
MDKTKTTRPYPLRIPQSLMELADAKSRAERTDRSTALRQLLYTGAEEYVLELLSEGRISTTRAADILDVSVHRMHELAQKHGLKLGATLEDHRRSVEEARELIG